MKILYFRPNGERAENTIVESINKNDNEVIFMELLGISTPIKGGLRIKGKETYKRLFVQRVYPFLERVAIKK